MRRAPPLPAAEPWPACSGDPAPTTRKKPPWGSFGAPVCPTKGSEDCGRIVRAAVFFVCLLVGGDTGREEVCFGCWGWVGDSWGGRVVQSLIW